MPIFRFKGEVLLILGVVVLLATGVSNVPIPSAQASTQANTQALQTLVNNKDPVAIVFHLCKFQPKTSTTKASCPDWGKYFYVHNGMALANLTENEPRAEVGHVAVWKTPVKWYICSLAHILDSANPQECKHGCPSIEPPSGCQDDKAYWVRDRTLGNYTDKVTINDPSIGMQKITVNKVPIAFKVGSETHNGVFVCFLKQNDTKCQTTIPTQASPGRLYYEHYVNRTAGQGDYASKPDAFQLVADASKEGKSIEVVDLQKLTFT